MSFGESGNSITAKLEDASQTPGALHHELMKSCPPTMRLRVHKAFVRNNYDLLKSVRLPWFVPESMGGIGLRPFLTVQDSPDQMIENATIGYLELDGVRYGPSDLDLKCCRIYLNKFEKKIHVKRMIDSQPIKAREVWFKRKGFVLPSFNLVGSLSSVLKASITSQDTAFPFMDLAMFYLYPYQVCSGGDFSNVWRDQVRKNERGWVLLTICALKHPGFPGFAYLQRSRAVKSGSFEMPVTCQPSVDGVTVCMSACYDDGRD
jgi:hypothetical protein